MNKHTTLALLALMLGTVGLTTLTACGGETTAPAVDPAATGTTPPPGTGTPPPAAGPANPTTIALGAPAVTVTTTAAPRWTFTVPAAGEYQIDAMGMPADAQLYVLDSSNWTTTSDSDSGDGLDARIQYFFEPGTYTVRVHEYNHAAASIRVSATALAPMTPVATIAPGAPPTPVVAPEGDGARAASVEVALTVATPGNYALSLTTADTGCSPEITVILNNARVGSVISAPTSGQPATETRALVAGTYTLRVRNWWNHACTMSLTANAAP